MFSKLRTSLYRLLRWSEKYLKADMVYFMSGNFWLNVSRVISIGSGIFLTIAFTRLLTPEQFGTYKYVIAAAGLIGTFSLNGLATAVMRAVAQGKFNVIPASFRAAMLWTIPASLAALGVGAYYFIQGNNELGYAFTFIALTNSVSNGISTTKGVWGAAREFKMYTLVGIPKIFVPFLIILFTIVFTKNVTWILFAYFFSNLALSLGGYFFMKWWFKVKAGPDGVDETLKYGKQMTVLGFFQIASGQIDQLLLWHFATPAALAIYALALTPVNEARNLIANVAGIMFPKIAAKTEKEIHNTLPLRIKQTFIASVVLTIIYAATVPLLFTYVFPKYLDSILVSQVLSLLLLFQFNTIIDTYLIAHGEIKRRAKLILTTQFVEFALFFILIPFFGLWGAVGATVLSELITASIFLAVYLRTRANFKERAQ